MTVQPVTDLTRPIGEILQEVGVDGVLLESPGQQRYALIPLNDDLLDYLLERSPKLIEACQEIRQRMQGGQFHSHEDVKRLLGEK
jgi:hypothetical protein